MRLGLEVTNAVQLSVVALVMRIMIVGKASVQF
jgi:hypothetical protein